MHLSGEMSACSLSFATLAVVTLIKVIESKNEIKIQNFILENFWKTKYYCYVRVIRWLNCIFLRGYLPSLSINYVAMSKDMGKRLPYYQVI